MRTIDVIAHLLDGVITGTPLIGAIMHRRSNDEEGMGLPVKLLVAMVVPILTAIITAAFTAYVSQAVLVERIATMQNQLSKLDDRMGESEKRERESNQRSLDRLLEQSEQRKK